MSSRAATEIPLDSHVVLRDQRKKLLARTTAFACADPSKSRPETAVAFAQGHVRGSGSIDGPGRLFASRATMSQVRTTLHSRTSSDRFGEPIKSACGDERWAAKSAV
jgi:hypothetical protein